MSSKTKKAVFELPLKFVFTEAGASEFMRRNKKLARLKMGDNTEEYGVSLDKVTPGSLQRMLLVDYVSKIEVSGVDPVACRGEILDLSKLVIYGLLYRQYNFVSFSQILSLEPIKKWNRANPFTVIDEKTQFREGFFQLFLQEHAGEIADIRGDLLKPLRDSITKSTSLQADEKNTQILLGEKFLDASNPIIWFVLLKFQGTQDFFTIMRETRSCLTEYMNKSLIAEYAALLIIELAVNMENLNIVREAKQLYKDIDIQTILVDSKLRDILINELKKKNGMVTMSWKIGGGSSSIGTRGRFQITLYNKDIPYREIRDSIEATKSADVNRKNLSDFYKELSLNGTDSELGIYYLSYVNEACEKMGIKFESTVSQVPDTSLTITTLSFYL
ncbi:MAG: hypothetical protein LBP32_06150 [Spirochaetaceae bacterium]|nr:hypothetical protein [Spirochaetaceae bacterium]